MLVRHHAERASDTHITPSIPSSQRSREREKTTTDIHVARLRLRNVHTNPQYDSSLRFSPHGGLYHVCAHRRNARPPTRILRAAATHATPNQHPRDPIFERGVQRRQKENPQNKAHKRRPGQASRKIPQPRKVLRANPWREKPWAPVLQDLPNRCEFVSVRAAGTKEDYVYR